MPSNANVHTLPILMRRVVVISTLIALAAFIAIQTDTAAQSSQVVFQIAQDSDVTIAGETGDRFGSSVSVGDINGDGRADILVGAPESDLDSSVRSGAAFGFFGPIDASVTDSSQADVKFKGFDFRAGIGSAVMLRDIDEDGAADIVVSSEKMEVDANRQGSGLIFVTLGPVEATGPSAIDITEREDFRILGAGRNFSSGKGMAAGDLNNDGFIDIAIGSPTGHELQRGGVEILYGPFDGSEIDLRDEADKILVGSVAPTGTRRGDGAGASVAVGDLNGDGIDDLVANARGADVGDIENAGETYVVFGPVEDLEGELKSLADITLRGDTFKDEASESSLAVGDLDGDGLNELVVGSMSSDASGDRGAGKVFILKGPLQPGIFTLQSAADIVIEGENIIDTFGSGVGIGDLNGDGVQDLALGASFWDPDGTSRDDNSGAVYVMYGNIFDREPTPPGPNLLLIAIVAAAAIAVGAVVAFIVVFILRRRQMRQVPTRL